MRLHRNHLPPDVTTPPRKHAEILAQLEYALAMGLDMFCDDRVLQIFAPEYEQPGAAGMLLSYPRIGDEHFEMQMKDAKEGKVAVYSFADIFDGAGSESGSEVEEGGRGEEEAVPVDPALEGGYGMPVDPGLWEGAVPVDPALLEVPAPPATPVLRPSVLASPVSASPVSSSPVSASPVSVPVSPVLGAAVPASPVLGTVVPVATGLGVAVPGVDIDIPLSAVLGGPAPGEPGPSNWYERLKSSEVDRGRPGSPTLGRSHIFNFDWEDEEE